MNIKLVIDHTYPIYMINGIKNFHWIKRENGMFYDIARCCLKTNYTNKQVDEKLSKITLIKSIYGIISINGKNHAVRISNHWGILNKSTFTLNHKIKWLRNRNELVEESVIEKYTEFYIGIYEL